MAKILREEAISAKEVTIDLGDTQLDLEHGERVKILADDGHQVYWCVVFDCANTGDCRICNKSHEYCNHDVGVAQVFDDEIPCTICGTMRNREGNCPRCES